MSKDTPETEKENTGKEDNRGLTAGHSLLQLQGGKGGKTTGTYVQRLASPGAAIGSNPPRST